MCKSDENSAKSSTLKILSYVETLQASKAQAHLRYLAEQAEEESVSTPRRPFVTITYAQSIDGKIGIIEKKGDGIETRSSNFPISGPESLVLTHALRSVHDAVIVGSGTMKTDNPRLNVRHWNITDGHQPRSVVIDTNMKNIPADCRAEHLIVCCSEAAALKYKQKHSHPQDKQLTILGCRTSMDSYSHLDLGHVLERLHDQGIHSVMVEGGASMLSSFARADLVDAFAVTIAPKLVGFDGLDAFSGVSLVDGVSSGAGVNLSNPIILSLGRDVVIVGEWPHMK